MAINRLKHFVLWLSLIAVAGFSSFSGTNSDAQTKASAEEVVLKKIAAYQTWTRVSETPVMANKFTIDGTDS